jgi:hypothetical protein
MQCVLGALYMHAIDMLRIQRHPEIARLSLHMTQNFALADKICVLLHKENNRRLRALDAAL